MNLCPFYLRDHCSSRNLKIAINKGLVCNPVSYYTTKSLGPVSLVKLEKREMSSRATMAGPEWSRFGRLEFFPYTISTQLSSKIRPIARRKEFWSFQWEPRAGGRSETGVRSARVLSLSKKHTIILQNPTNRKAERILLDPMRTEGWGAAVEQGAGGWSSFPIQYKHMIIHW